MSITSILAACLMLMPIGDGDKDGKKRDNDVRDTYYKYEREEVSYYRDRVDFRMPPIPVQEIEENDPVEIIPVEGSFVGGKRLVIEADDRLEEFINRHKQINASKKTVDGYRVQIFADRGSSGRAQAERAKTIFLSNYPDIKAYYRMVYPLYQVRVGDFMRSEEAELFCREVWEIFPSAFVVKNVQVEVPKYKPSDEQKSKWNRN